MVTEATTPLRESLASDEILDRLSLIGQDITASLDFEDIFAAVERHVGVLLDAATFYIGILDETRQWIDIPLFVDGGRRIASRRLSMDEPERPARRTMLQNCEILREKTLKEALRNDLPDTTPTLTALFRPLVVRERIIGLMSVQSARMGAYGERERLIFRTLCAYVAVALSNSASFTRLAAVEAEKMASLTRLVAGMAHEVNTPVGMALTVATTFGRAAQDFKGKLETGTLRRADLDAYAALGVEAARQVTANLMRMTDLMSEFRQVGLDRKSARARNFRLADLVGSVLISLSVELQRRRCIVALAELELFSDPEALERVLINLAAGVLAFGCPGGEGSTLRVEAEMSTRNEVCIAVSDDGAVIPEAEAASIFEPFSPTSRGSRGLGLHVAYTLAVGVLGGTLTCQTSAGAGTTFRLVIPSRVSAPQGA